MAAGSYGAYRLEVGDLREARDRIVGRLTALGLRVGRKTAIGPEVRIEAIRGNRALAVLMGLLPLVRLFGWGSRTGVTITCRKSLNPGDASFRMSIRCIPLQELADAEEVPGLTQDHVERLGDDEQARRCLTSLVAALREDGVIAPHA